MMSQFTARVSGRPGDDRWGIPDPALRRINEAEQRLAENYSGDEIGDAAAPAPEAPEGGTSAELQDRVRLDARPSRVGGKDVDSLQPARTDRVMAGWTCRATTISPVQNL